MNSTQEPAPESPAPIGTPVSDVAWERRTRMLEFANRCNKEIIRAASEMELLEAICHEAVESGGFAASWAGFYENGTDGAIVPLAQAGIRSALLLECRFSQDEGNNIEDQGLRTAEPPQPEAESTCEFGEMLRLPISENTRTAGLWVLLPHGSRGLSTLEIDILESLAETVSLRLACHRNCSELKHACESILKLSIGGATAPDDDALTALLSHAMGTLGANAGFITQWHSCGTRSSTICGVVDDNPAPRFEYSLAGSPCGLLAESDSLLIGEAVATLHPGLPFITAETQAYAGARLQDATGAVTGSLFLLFNKPRQEDDFICPALRILAARANRELDRRKPESLMRSQTALLDRARDAIFVHDLDYRITYWNQGAAKLYGWSPDEAVGSIARGFLYQNPAALMMAAEITLSKGEWAGELTHVTKDHEELTVESRWSLMRDERGNPLSILSINTDITARKKLEQQFLRAQRMESIGTLAGGIAHDINNILSPIMMSIDLLRMYVTDPDALNIIGMMATSAKRGAEMVQQVLSFARGVEGKAEEVRVSLVVEDLLRIIEDTFPKNIRVETRLQPDLWPVKADPTQIHQVLLNLCVNARDAMPDGGRLTLTVQKILIDDRQAAFNLDAHPGPYLVIEVEDTGHGIPKEIIDKIFDPFFTTKAQGKGTGLGLSTTLAIMKSHGGYITAHSEPGEGSRFRIHLPAMTELGWDSAPSADTDLPRGRGETVMVVDDEIFIRQVTSRTLESFGYKVLLASNGSEAITTYVEHQDEIALVLTDMMMPVMDGPATIRTLKRLNPFVRIIGASGINAKSNVARASNAGADHFLTKPFTAETLLKTIRLTLRETTPRGATPRRSSAPR